MSAAPLLAAFLLTAAPDAAPAPPANVLWITCEDLSPRLGSYGDPLARTPHLDGLAAEGTRYTHAFGVYGVCAPNRFTLITGTYPTAAGAGPMRTTSRTSALADVTDPALRAIPTWEATPPAPVTCVPERLRAAGYYCTNNVKQDYQFTPPVILEADGLVTIRCETAGASIGYQLPGDETWRVYAEPFTPELGETVRAIAHRIGWKPSQRATLTP